jgi:hypothetical protein
MPVPHWHVALSPVVYATARATRFRRPVLAAAVSVAIDADHLADLGYFKLTGCRDRQLVPLHSWELALIGLASSNRTARALSAGALAHLLTDWAIGGYDFLQLSLAYRLAKKFRTGRMGRWVEWPRDSDAWKAFLSPSVRDAVPASFERMHREAGPTARVLAARQ